MTMLTSKGLLRLLSFVLAISVVVSIASVMGTIPTVKADPDPAGGYWDHCTDGRTGERTSGGRNMSGCTVEFWGASDAFGACSGTYYYSCQNTYYTCVYVYGNNIPCGGSGGGGKGPGGILD